MRPGDPQDFCHAHDIPAIREMQAQGIGLLEIGLRMNINKSAIDKALWVFIGVPTAELQSRLTRPQPMF